MPCPGPALRRSSSAGLVACHPAGAQVVLDLVDPRADVADGVHQGLVGGAKSGGPMRDRGFVAGVDFRRRIRILGSSGGSGGVGQSGLVVHAGGSFILVRDTAAMTPRPSTIRQAMAI